MSVCPLHSVGIPGCGDAYAAAALGRRYASPLTSAAQTIRASLLASATVTRRGGRRSSSRLSQAASVPSFGVRIRGPKVLIEGNAIDFKSGGPGEGSKCLRAMAKSATPFVR